MCTHTLEAAKHVFTNVFCVDSGLQKLCKQDLVQTKDYETTFVRPRTRLPLRESLDRCHHSPRCGISLLAPFTFWAGSRPSSPHLWIAKRAWLRRSACSIWEGVGSSLRGFRTSNSWTIQVELLRISVVVRYACSIIDVIGVSSTTGERSHFSTRGQFFHSTVHCSVHVKRCSRG